MRYLGIDLAWADSATGNETGLVALDGDGRIRDADWRVGVERTVAWIAQRASQDALVFMDAPLVVLNAVGQRRCETEVGQRYGRWKVSANSTNLASARLAGVLVRQRLEAQGWRYSDGTSGPPAEGRTVSECYPYTTLVGAGELGYDTERPRYKRKPRALAAAEWRPRRAEACDELIKRVASLRDATPPLDLRSHPTTAQLLADPSPLADREYKHREDLIDACLAAWSAALWATCGLMRSQVLGGEDALVSDRGARATIIAPARPEQRRGTMPSDC